MNTINGVEFKNWEETAKARFTGIFGRDNERSTFQFPDGTVVYLEAYFPRNWMKKNHTRTIVEIIVPKNKETIELAEKYGAILEEEYYGKENDWWFVFTAMEDEVGKDTMEMAWNFIAKEGDFVRKLSGGKYYKQD